MKTFKYKGITESGAEMDGVVEAFDELDAVERIKPKCNIVTEVTEIKGRASWNITLNKKITPKSLSVVCSQFSIILSSGIPIVRCVELIADQCEDETLQGILKQAAGDVAAGMSLAHSLENKGGKFLPATLVETIRAGEESGTLENSFARLKVYYEKEAATKNKVKSAMMYPIFLLSLAVVVVAVCMVMLVPSLVSTFNDLGMDLPIATKIIMAMSDFFIGYWWLLIIIVVALIIGTKYYKKTEKGRLFFSGMYLKIPVIKELSVVKNAAQFANTMSTLLSSGITAIKALEGSAKVLDNYTVSTRTVKAVSDVISGKTISQSISKCGFPTLLVEMTSVGEESGRLEETLSVIGDYYDNETELKTKKVLGILEPAILVFLALIVAFILVGVYLPIFTMYGGMAAAA